MKQAERQLLQSHVRVERMELTAELRSLERRDTELQRRINKIYARLVELDKADALLETD